jgi:hypothetical protein
MSTTIVSKGPHAVANRVLATRLYRLDDFGISRDLSSRSKTSLKMEAFWNWKLFLLVAAAGLVHDRLHNHPPDNGKSNP